jgi:hypothetical protein
MSRPTAPDGSAGFSASEISPIMSAAPPMIMGWVTESKSARSAVQRGEERRALPAEEAEGPVVHVEIQQAELACAPAPLLHAQHMRRDRIADRRVQAERPWPNGYKSRSGSKVATCEQGHLMPECQQLFREDRHNPFSIAAELGWRGLLERGNLGNSHCNTTFHRQGPMQDVASRSTTLTTALASAPNPAVASGSETTHEPVTTRTDRVRRPSGHLARRFTAR